MACSGAHCNNHSTGFTTCSGHRAASASGNYGSGGGHVDALLPNSHIKAADIERLRKALYDEIVRWRQHPSYSGLSLSAVSSPFTSGEPAEYSKVKRIQDRLGTGIKAAKGGKIYLSQYNNMVNAYKQMKKDCICNSDCSCNAVCSCHNNCGCNYSDKRLKMEIQYC